MNYIGWALLGMAGYSAVTLFAKLATRSGAMSPFLVLAIATPIVVATVWTIAIARGDLHGRTLASFATGDTLWALAAGIALAVAVASLFKGLSMGPASVVVPIYGMFILGGSVLGMAFLGEPLTLRKAIGLIVAVVGVYLIAG